MRWFAAHIIMVAKLKNQHQNRFPVWENIVLVSAESEGEAFAKAEAYARREEGDDDGSFRWGGHPARWVFAGVRKLTECATLGERPEDGTEVSCNELELDSQEAVEQLVAGRPTLVRYHDRYRTVKRAKPTDRTKRMRKKRAFSEPHALKVQ